MLRTKTLLTLAGAALGAAAAVACGDASGSDSPDPVAPSGAHTAHTGIPAERRIRGAIELPGQGAVSLTDYQCIFLMGWRDAREGSPQLVRRLPAASLPLDFEVDARDLMGPGTIAGRWVFVARLDADGDAAAARGDLEGTSEQMVVAGGESVRIVLTRTLDAGDERALEVGTSHGGEAPSRSTPRPPTQPAGHPPMTTAATSAADLAGPRIRGIIQLPAGQTSKNGTGTLFLTVRSTDSGRGMPTAAVKVDNPVFPYHFDLGTENIPLNVDNKADMLQGQLYLNGSLDGDGNAFSKLAGDLYFDPVPVRAGADELTISLDQEREPQ